MMLPSLLIGGSPGAAPADAMAALGGVPASLADNGMAGDIELATWSEPAGPALRLLGLGGQGGFDDAWCDLARDALGLVLVIDNMRPDPLADLVLWVEGFWDALAELPCVVGVARTDECRSPGLDEYAACLADRGLVLPVAKVDPREREDILLLCELLLAQLDAMRAGAGSGPCP